MADALPLPENIALTSPIITSTARVERFQTDSYSVRAMIGINGVDEKVSVQWLGLTASEARTVSNFLKNHALNLIEWAPEPWTTSRYWTCANHSTEHVMANAARSTYNITAELVREFDPLS